MKKFLSLACLAIIMLTGKAYSQNLTWTFKDQPEKGFFKTHTTFNVRFSGFKNKEESVKLIAALKAYRELTSVTVSNTDAEGNFDAILSVKDPRDKTFYIGLAQKLGVNYMEHNGKKKAPAELMKNS